MFEKQTTQARFSVVVVFVCVVVVQKQTLRKTHCSVLCVFVSLVVLLVVVFAVVVAVRVVLCFRYEVV